MKVIFIFCLLSLGLYTFSPLKAQSKSPFQVEVVDNLYLLGLAQVTTEVAKKVQVKFATDVVRVQIPNGSQSILLEILNTDCQAYCPKVKRVRQLYPGDEQLLRNIINKQKNLIFTQLQKSGVSVSE